MSLHISHQHRALVFPFNPAVIQLFPHAKQIQWEDAPHIALPHGNDETRLLRNLGMTVPAPIVEHYDWPGPDQPFEVQVKTAAMLTMHPRAFVLNQMGTGKTRAALWAFDWLRREGIVKKMLVVGSLSNLRFVWQREAMRLFFNYKVAVLDGDKARRKKELDRDCDIYVINHDGIKVMARELEARKDIDVICIDEVAAFRNAGADRSKVMQAISKDRAWVWGLTGSPTPTSPTDAFGLAKLIVPHTAPRSFSFFRNETMYQAGPFKWLAKADAADVVARTLQPSVCFTLEDTTELPQVIERQVDVEQGKRQSQVYAQLKEHMAVLMKEGQVTASNGGVCLSKMLQVSCGYVYMDDQKAAELDNERRLDELIELIDGARAKVIVFAPFIHAVKGIAERLTREGLDHAVVHGGTAAGERDRIFQAFQSTTQYDVIVAHPQCMAHGLTLTAADTIVWFAPITSLEIFEQANARISRIGQTRKQQVFMLQGTAAERQVYARLRSKRDVQASVLDLIQGLMED